MERVLHVSLGEKSYDITVKAGLLDSLGARLQSVYTGGRVFVVTDTNVEPLYGARTCASLAAAGFEARLFAVPAGEKSKSLAELAHVFEAMLDFGLKRGELVLTLGGGVVGDLGGFAAASYLRGVPFVQVPTTLLAQVDSSVGGKVAVDLPRGKNLVGAFYQPKAVFIDTSLLNTLPERTFRDGLAEVIKTAAIRDEALFALLESCAGRAALMEHMDEIVAACCAVKKTVVENDEFDLGERMLLNFGHTLGHALEAHYGFETYGHGEAVAAGMAEIMRIAAARGLTPHADMARLEALLSRHGLPTVILGAARGAVRRGVSVDKKNLGGRLNVILLHKIGDAFIHPTDASFFGEDVWESY